MPYMPLKLKDEKDYFNVRSQFLILVIGEILKKKYKRNDSRINLVWT